MRPDQDVARVGRLRDRLREAVRITRELLLPPYATVWVVGSRVPLGANAGTGATVLRGAARAQARPSGIQRNTAPARR